MKNLKKVLALALAFVMCFTMFAGAAVYTDVPAGSDYSEAVTLLSDLGVIAGKPDGSYGVNDTITRADAACLIARLMTGETTPSKYAGASNFTDVAKDAYYESSVAYCAIMGITSGTGNGAYSPLRTITDGEFIAMVTRALGYDTAENPLQFPMGNIAVAQAEGLLDGVNCVASSPALRGEDAQIVYNALFADYDRAARNQNIYQGADDHANFTIAEEVFNLARLAVAKGDDNDEADFYDKDERDDITCVAHTWVVAGKDTRDGENEYTAYSILDKNNDLNTKDPITFSYDGDAESILGYQVELWGDVSHTGDDFEVVAVKTVKGQTGVEWNPSMDTDGTKAKVDDEKYQTNTAAMPVRVTADKTVDGTKIQGAFTKTGSKQDAFELVTGKNIMNKYMDKENGDQYRLCDWDSDGDIDFIIRDVVKYAKVTSLTNKRIGLESTEGSYSSSKGYNISLDEDELVVEVDDDVEKDDIVEIAVTDRSWTKSDKEIVTITLSKVDGETKELTKLTTKSKEAEFDGEGIKAAEDGGFWDVVEPDDPEDYDYDDNRGADYTLYLNRNGFIVFSSEDDSDNAGYLMVLDTGKGSKATNNRKLATIDVMYDDGKYAEDVEVVSSLKVQDIDKETIDEAYDDDDREFYEPAVVGRVFKYYKNSDDQITKLVAATDALSTNYTYNEKNDRLAIDGANYALEGAKAIFMIEQDAIELDNPDHMNELGADSKEWLNWHIDDDKVDIVAQEDLEDLDDVDAAKFTEIKGTGISDSWFTDANKGNFNTIKIAYDADDNRDVKVAVLGVDNLLSYKATTKIALITDVSWSSGDEVEIEGAMDGEVSSWTSADVDDLDDVFEDYTNNNTTTSLTSVKKIESMLGDGRYAEVTFNKDNEIKKIKFLEVKANTDGKVLTGDKYDVVRVVVGATVKDSRFSYVDLNKDVIFADDEKFFKIDTKSDNGSFDIGDDTDFYTIDGEPTVETDKYENEVLKITNYFDGLDISADKFLKASIFNNNDHDGDYYVVDVAFEPDAATTLAKVDPDGDVAAVFAFDGVMNEEETSVVLSSDKVTFTYGDVADNENSPILVTSPNAADVSISGSNEGLTITKSDAIYVYYDGTTPVGTYKYTVFAKGYKDATLTVVVEKKNLGEAEVDVYTTEGQSVQTITINDADEVLTETTGLKVSKIKAGENTNNVPASATAALVDGDLVITLTDSDYQPLAGSSLIFTIETANYTGTVKATFKDQI